MSAPTLSPCGEIVRRGDSARFLAAMTAPPVARERLFTLYAFNLEIARIPAVVSEPMLGQIRLQWWRETLAMIYDDGRVRSHEVVEPLAALIEETALPHAVFSRLLDARLRDIEGTPPESRAALDGYLRDTGGALLALTAHAMAGTPVDTDEAGFAFATAAYLEAVPTLGPEALPGDPATLAAALAEDGLAALDSARAQTFPEAAVPALRAGWLTRWTLRQALAPGYDPLIGPRRRSPLRRHLALLWRAARGRW